MARRRGDVSMFEVLREAERSGFSNRHTPSQDSTPDPIAERGSPDPSLLLGDDGSAGNHRTTSQKRKRVDLDDPVARIPRSKELPVIDPTLKSSRVPVISWWGRRLEVRMANVVVVAVGFILALFLSFQLGIQKGTSDLPEVMGKTDDPPWFPVIDPDPEPIEVIRSPVDAEGNPIAIVPSTVESAEVSIQPAVHLEPRRLYVVMVAQTLRDPAQTDRLVRYLNSQAIGASANVLTGRGRDGTRMSVFVGPFEERVEAQKVCGEVRRLRRAVGTDFKESYPTRVEFSVEELKRFGVRVRQ
ncbi:MAG TPA: SPOR domain-containing protein [Planctomycetes bacterium]|nr:SPOR domain-containing protein [Planctomycetota bacterium]